jgi:tripartite-type tricarboxylate transporter receptor subunit TctC
VNPAPYPNHPITVAAPFPPGHVSDLHPRLLAPHVADALQQPVTIENWPGRSGAAALERLKDVEPDGYTVMLHGYGGLAVTPHLVNVNYDPRTDFSPIIRLVRSAPLVLVVHSSLPVESARRTDRAREEEP